MKNRRPSAHILCLGPPVAGGRNTNDVYYYGRRRFCSLSHEIVRFHVRPGKDPKGMREASRKTIAEHWLATLHCHTIYARPEHLRDPDPWFGLDMDLSKAPPLTIVRPGITCGGMRGSKFTPAT
jgi:hypothetical protein